MVKLGFMFPGQGAQYIGMGADLWSHYPEAKAVYEKASRVLGYDVATVCFNGPEGELNRTEVTQPAILTTSIAALTVLEARGIKPVAVAGLSLGEYTALVAAGAVDFEDAVQLLAVRGRLMQEAVKPGEGMMLAVSGLENEQVAQICDRFDIDAANYNCPGQVVVAGYTQEVQAAGEEFVRQGARVIPLTVSVPSHCRLMRPAAEKLAAYIEQLPLKTPDIPVISNVSGQPAEPAQIKKLLVAQLYSPVKWEQSLRLMLTQVDYLVEVGPGSVLAGLARRLDRKRVLGSVGNQESLEAFIEKVGVL